METILKGLRRLAAGIVTFGILTFAAMPKASAATGDVMVFGVVPQQSATRLAQAWVPLLREVSKGLPFRIEFATAKDIPTFEACLAKGAYDFAYMNPYHYVVFHDAAGYRAFAVEKDRKLTGLLVVRKDSPVRDLKGLAGMTIAFPSPAAFGASVIPRAELARQGIPFTPKYVKSHDSVYRAVASGALPAGGGVHRTFNTIDASIRGQLRIIYTTGKYSSHAFAAGPKVPAARSSALLERLVAVAASRPDIMKPIGMKGFEGARDGDWQDIRSLHLTGRQTQVRRDTAVKCLSD